MRLFKLLQGEVNQQFQLHDRELAPVSVFVKLNTNQRGNIAIIIQLVVLQAFQQGFQAVFVQGVQV